MKRPRIPSVYLALGTRFATDAGIDPDHFHAVAQGKVRDDDLARRLVVGLHDLVDPADFPGLTDRSKARTIHTMHTGTFERPKTGRPSRLKNHPLMKALAKRGIPLAEEAERVKRSVSSVRSFCFPGDDESFRPIPQALAEHWRDEYGVPLTAWPRKVS